MATDRPQNLIHRVSAAFEAVATPDEQLLYRFQGNRDEAAFAALVQRHGPMVLGVCRRVLHDCHDAEDAFQATFLVLARKAGSVTNPALLFHWLHSVAWRTAMEAKTRRLRRRTAEWQTPPPVGEGPPEHLLWAEVRQVLDEEIGRLPLRFRLPFVLCYLEGKTNEEAAGILGCPKGTVVSRLSRAKERLRQRLSRRGLGLTATTLAMMLADQSASAKVPAALSALTIKGVMQVQGCAAGAVSCEAAFLAEKVVSYMRWSKVKFMAFALLTVAAFCAATGLWTLRGAQASRGAADVSLLQAVDQEETPALAQGKADKVTDHDSIQGRWLVESVSKNGHVLSSEEIDNLLSPNAGPGMLWPGPQGFGGKGQGGKGKGKGGNPGFGPRGGAGPGNDMAGQASDKLALRSDGKDLPVFVITDKAIVCVTQYANTKGSLFTNYRVDASKKPAWLDFSRRLDGSPAKGIFRVDGDKMMIALGDEHQRPKKFASEAGSDTELWVLRREQAPQDTKRIQGNWRLVQIGVNGALLADDNRGDDHGIMTITGNKMTLQGGDLPFEGVFNLDSNHQPGWIDFMDTQDSPFPQQRPYAFAGMGSYILDGDTLSIVLDYGHRATNFVASSNTYIMYLKRIENLTSELLGQWRLTEAMEGGKRTRIAPAGDQPSILTVTPHRLTLASDGKTILEAAWQADALKKPRWIDLTLDEKARPLQGLYHITPDGMLLLVFDRSGLKGRPSAFTSELGTANDMYWVFERVSAGKKGGGKGLGSKSKGGTDEGIRPPAGGAATDPVIAALVQEMQSTDPKARSEAIKGLHELSARIDRTGHKLMKAGAQHAPKMGGLTPYLAKAAIDPVESIRLAALYALADTRDMEAIAALRERLSDPSKKVRLAAACVLSEFHDASGVEELRKAVSAARGNLAATPLTEVEQLLAALERITSKTFGEIPPLPTGGEASAAVRDQYQRLLDAWAAWWDWVPPSK
jgi:RNA polymerase sigma factor (sigma-70 family)